MFDQESPQCVSRLTVLRVPSGSTMAIQLLSGDWLRLSTHFHGRTFLCAEGVECDACQVLPSRVYWYLPVLAIQAKRVHLLELSASASADLEQKCRFVGSAPRAGVQVEVARRTKKSPLRFECIGQAEKAPLAQLHEWVSPLMALYRLPPLVVGETLEVYGRRVASRVVDRAKVAADAYRSAAAAWRKGRVGPFERV